MRKIISLMLFSVVATSAAVASPSRVLYDISLDMDGNGKAERAVLVLNGPVASGTPTPEIYSLGANETVDLLIYMDAGTAPLDASLAPQVRKIDIIDRNRFNWVGKLESNGRSSLKLSASRAPGSTTTEDETLTIVYRKGRFLVAGMDLYWEGGGQNGNCQYNFLTAEGYTAPGEFADNKTPIKAKVKAVPLEAWSPDTRPTVCDP